MTEPASVEDYLAGKGVHAVELSRQFEELVERCGPSDVTPRRSTVYWKRNRVWAGAYIERDRLELNIDLLREAEHPCMLAAFNTTKQVITHRLRITKLEQLDGSIAEPLQEAYDHVGPGARGR